VVVKYAIIDHNEEIMENKNCPFCGNSEIDFQYGTPDREGTPINVICVECGAGGPWVYANGSKEKMERKAIVIWNARIMLAI
jgi:Lar family restriction alleviation protein